MKYVRQMTIIFTAALLGELLRFLLPLPVPPSIYGLLLLFFALHFRVVRVDQVKESAELLIELMPLLFVAPAVAVLPYFGILRPILFRFVIAVAVSTALIMGAAGLATQYVIRRERGRGK